MYSVLQESGREYTSVETRARDLVQGGFIPSQTYPQYVSTYNIILKSPDQDLDFLSHDKKKTQQREDLIITKS